MLSCSSRLCGYTDPHDLVPCWFAPTHCSRRHLEILGLVHDGVGSTRPWIMDLIIELAQCSAVSLEV